MKRKLLAFFLALVVVFSVVGIWYYTSYPTIGISKGVSLSNDNFEKEYHSESINVWAAGGTFLPDSPLQKQKMDAVWEWNDPIILELTELRKDGGLAYNITVSGEIANGKTTLRYEGYIIKNNGKRIDYHQEKTFDFVLCSEKNFFTNRL